MTKTYAEMFDTGEGTRALTAEEIAEMEAQKAEAAKNIDTYKKFAEQKANSRDEAYAIVKAMREIHDAECSRLYQEGNKDAIPGHVAAFEAAKKEIMAPFKRTVRRRPLVATNIYDDDDNPTTHYLYL